MNVASVHLLLLIFNAMSSVNLATESLVECFAQKAF